MLNAQKGPPSKDDVPRRPSKPPRVLDGQIDIFGHVHSSRTDPADDEQYA
jgi:hypothetical protein